MIRALYIDEEVSSRKFKDTFSLLELMGVSITPVEQFDEALLAIENESAYDLILLDIMMTPDPFGYEETNGGHSAGLVFLAHIRHKGNRKPVIVVTAKTKDEIYHAAEVQKLNIAEVLTKPMDLSAKRIKMAIDKLKLSPHM